MRITVRAPAIGRCGCSARQALQHAARQTALSEGVSDGNRLARARHADRPHQRQARQLAAAQIIEPIAALTRAARERDGWLVVYGNDAHRPGDFELAVFGEHAIVGSPGAAVIGQLAPQPGDVIVPKRYYSAFTQTDLDATCRVRGITRLVVTGQHTDCCCRHTSYDAFARGITVIAVSDATAVYKRERQDHRPVSCCPCG